MARRTQTYAIRLAVEGGAQVKVEPVSVGQSGEQGLKRIEDSVERVRRAFKLFDSEGVALVNVLVQRRKRSIHRHSGPG